MRSMLAGHVMESLISAPSETAGAPSNKTPLLEMFSVCPRPVCMTFLDKGTAYVNSAQIG